MDRRPPEPEGVSDARAEALAAPHTRREALKAVGKYAAFAAAGSTVMLSADEALAQNRFNCSRVPNQYFFLRRYCENRNGNVPNWYLELLDRLGVI